MCLSGLLLGPNGLLLGSGGNRMETSGVILGSPIGS